jgi:glycosyltransferase involved in cell wall biosynthesis
MKYPFTGLYYYCLHLKKNLQAINEDKELCFYIREMNKDLFRDSCTFIQHSLHKFFFPSLKDFSIWHSTYQGTMYYPWKQKIKILFTVHDLNFLYDESKSEWKKKRYLSQVAAKIDRADHIVAISNFVLSDIKKHINIDGKQCSVIYNGCNIEEVVDLAEPVSKPEVPFLFTVGTIVDKKNFHVLPALLINSDWQLLISGVTNSEEYKNKIINEARRLGVDKRLIFTGPVSENDKQWYYKNCEAFVFPSISEGFGLPVIEAMYFGRPVILSTHTSLPEIGGSAAYYFQNFEPEHMQQVLYKALEDHKINARENEIKNRALLFNWKSTAHKYQEVYNNLLKKN